MPPKASRTHRGASSSRRRGREPSPPLIDEDIFVSEEAFVYYEQTVKKKPIIAERGFQDITRAHNQDLFDTIQHYQWQQFAHHPDLAVISLVREFYANALCTEHAHVVYVRGHPVDYSAASIRRIFHMPAPPPQCAYSAMLSLNPPGVDLATVTARICHPDRPAQWTLSQTQRPRYFRRESLTPAARVWYLFIAARILPTSNLSEVYREQAILIYAILERRPIDVAQVIFSQLRRCIDRSSALLFPSLIQELCLRAGVIVSPTEERVAARLAITEGIIQNIVGAPPPRLRRARPEPPPRADAVPNADWRMMMEQQMARLAAMQACQYQCLRWLAEATGRPMDTFPVPELPPEAAAGSPHPPAPAPEDAEGSDAETDDVEGEGSDDEDYF